jgi:hypothetical protein
MKHPRKAKHWYQDMNEVVGLALMRFDPDGETIEDFTRENVSTALAVLLDEISRRRGVPFKRLTDKLPLIMEKVRQDNAEMPEEEKSFATLLMIIYIELHVAENFVNPSMFAKVAEFFKPDGIEPNLAGEHAQLP